MKFCTTNSSLMRNEDVNDKRISNTKNLVN